MQPVAVTNYNYFPISTVVSCHALYSTDLRELFGTHHRAVGELKMAWKIHPEEWKDPTRTGPTPRLALEVKRAWFLTTATYGIGLNQAACCPMINTVVDKQTRKILYSPNGRIWGFENMIFGLHWSQGLQNTPNLGHVTNFSGGQNFGPIFDNFFWLGWVARASRY